MTRYFILLAEILVKILSLIYRLSRETGKINYGSDISRTSLNRLNTKYFSGYISTRSIAILFLLALGISSSLFSRQQTPETNVFQNFFEDPVTPFKDLQKRSVSILFAGDTHFEWAIGELQKKNSVNYPVEDIRSIFLETDYKILNLETTISDKAKPVNAKSYVFRSNITNSLLLNYLGINLAVLGNNHTMDMGSDGLTETISNLQNINISSAGAGLNIKDAASPYYFQLRGINFAVLSYNAIGDRQIFSSENSPGTALLSPAAYKQISQVKKNVNHVIVSIHWGTEYSPRPDKQQIQIAHKIIDSGATAIIGHHPHIPQGIEFYKNGVIVYSLGNFLFGSVIHYQTDNFMVKLLFHPEKKLFEGIEIYPITGNYKKMGHKIINLKNDESESFWRRFYTQCYELNLKNPQIEIHPTGYGSWLVEK